MAKKNQTKEKLESIPILGMIIQYLKKVKPFEGISIYAIISMYITGLVKGALTTRASAVAFSLAMAVFPFSIFLITLLGNVNFLKNTFWELLQNALPPNTYNIVYEYMMSQIFENKDFQLLSFSFLVTALLATNGINSLLGNLDYSYHKLETRTVISKYRISFILTLALTLLLVLTLYGIFELEITILNLRNSDYYFNKTLDSMLAYSKYLIAFFFLFISLSLIYAASIKNVKSIKVIFPGTLLSSFLIVLTSYLFGIYATKFARYNELYGSLGTMLLLMFWIYLNCIVVITGFELNASIFAAKKKARK